MNPNMANREVAELTFVDYSTKKPFLFLDYANTTSYDLTGESVFAYGGQGHPARVSFTGERGGTLTIETQIQPFKLYEMITGGTMSDSGSFMKREEITVGDGGVITLGATPTGEVSFFMKDDDMGEALIAEAEEGSTTSYTAEGVVANDIVVAYYLTALTGTVKRINIKNTSFPRAFTVYGETIYKTEDDEILPMKLIYYKLQPQASISVSMANTGDPATLTITCDLMVDSDGNLMDMIEIIDDTPIVSA